MPDGVNDDFVVACARKIAVAPSSKLRQGINIAIKPASTDNQTMEPATAALIGAGIAAFSGLMGALTTAYLGGWRQERIEGNKRKWTIEDAKANRLDDAIRQLTIKLASAQHSMCWLTWLASEAPHRLTHECAAAYDKEMHIIIPEFLGFWSQIASLDMEAYSRVTSIIESVEGMDVRIGRACLNVVNDKEGTAKTLADLYPECVAMAADPPELMARAFIVAGRDAEEKVAMNTTPLTSEQRHYHIEEYKSLKVEIADAFKESFQIVIFSVTANAAIISFISSNKGGTGLELFSYFERILPLLVSIAAYALFLLRRRSISRIAKYLYSLEQVFAAQGFGWESYYAKDIANRVWFIRTPFVLNVIMIIQITYALLFMVLPLLHKS